MSEEGRLVSIGSPRTDAVDATACWPTVTLSSRHPAALSLYRDGIATLVAGAPFASALLRQALACDPDFALACVGLAVADAVGGRPFAAAAVQSALTRGERQHEEIVRAAFCGDVARACDLRRVHLLEFPGDVLIVWLPAALSERQCWSPQRVR